eukprot:TRINITY_DN3401_c0_g1_i1.p1 TRINITY_DN3401_c0_g1~~TRINITY_DN3401_c0_g1_i1.p1  ORF type:complete len:277 (-),score=37.19 TRINITY_DN3401_c0_g1_i1:143-973(-)
MRQHFLRRLSTFAFASLRRGGADAHPLGACHPFQHVRSAHIAEKKPFPLPSTWTQHRHVTLLSLSDLRDNKGARTKKTRKGRGIGSGKGKTCGRGHKGQKARGKVKLGFEGGQTPLRKRLPKKYFHDPFALSFRPVSLKRIAKFINSGHIDSSELITMKTLRDSGAVGKKIGDGIELVEHGAELIKWPIHIEVSRTTEAAKAAVEAAGGTVTKVHYNKLGLRALLKPEAFAKKGRLLPKPARSPPKIVPHVDAIGRLPAPTKPMMPKAEHEIKVQI